MPDTAPHHDPAPPDPALPDPAQTADAPVDAAPERPGHPDRRPVGPLYRATAVVALVGVLATLVGIVLLLRPVETPTQDCGTSLAVLLQGRPNEFVDPNDPPEGVTAEEAVANNERPCRTIVAEEAQTSARLIAGGMVVAVAATLVEVIARAVARHRRHRALRRAVVEPDDQPTPDPEADPEPQPI